jgi:hypothetical protein
MDILQDLCILEGEKTTQIKGDHTCLVRVHTLGKEM